MNLKTENLIIRDFKKTDDKLFYEFAKNANVGPNCNWEPHPDVKFTKLVIKQYLKQKDTFAICLPNDDIIGTIQVVHYPLRDETYELGYCINPSYWNKNYATKACYSMMKYYFNFVRCNTIIALTKEENVQSIRVLEKLGFEYEGTLRNCKKDVKARYINCKCFSICKNNFERIIEK